ncbi:hypothetical protein [Proteus penneri]|nr:hypothetical protein [Proteus penneri]
MIGIIKLVDASISLADNLIDFVIKHYDLISMVFYYKKNDEELSRTLDS